MKSKNLVTDALEKIKLVAAQQALKAYCKKLAPDVYTLLIKNGCDFALIDIGNNIISQGISETGEVKIQTGLGDHTETTNKVREQAGENSVNLTNFVKQILVKISGDDFNIKIFAGDLGQNFEMNIKIKDIKTKKP